MDKVYKFLEGKDFDAYEEDGKYKLEELSNQKQIYEFDTFEELAETISNVVEQPINYQVYLSMQNPYIIDASQSEWYDIQGRSTNDWVAEIAKDNKYDGIIFKGLNDSSTEWQAQDNSDVYVAITYSNKSIYNEGTFNEYDPDINYQLKESDIVKVPGFYSNLENTINDKMGKRAKAKDLMNMLTKNGVKPEEMEWFNIASLLEGKDFVYKEEVLDHMREKSIEFYTKDMGGEFSSYTLDGGDNYRFNAYVYNNNPGTPFVYQPHFGSMQNVIGHTRYMDRVGTNGEKGTLNRGTSIRLAPKR